MFFVILYTIPGDFLELSAEVGLSLAVPQLGVEARGICPGFWVDLEESSGNLGDDERIFNFWEVTENWNDSNCL